MATKKKIPIVEPHYTRLQQKFGQDGKLFYEAITSRLLKNPHHLIKDNNKLRKELSKELNVSLYRVTQLIEDSTYLFQFFDNALAEREYLFCEDLLKVLVNSGQISKRKAIDILINAEELKLKTPSTMKHDFNLKGLNFEVREVKSEIFKLRLDVLKNLKMLKCE